MFSCAVAEDPSLLGYGSVAVSEYFPKFRSILLLQLSLSCSLNTASYSRSLEASG
jgi:hypothetical protein